MKIIHHGKLKRVEFTFALGDLFDAEVDAIVSSEQTDFVLSETRNRSVAKYGIGMEKRFSEN